jgi:branched-chain amino acid transport system permease protein
MPLLVTLLIAALSGFVGALFIGFFCVRLKGAYFALITLAFQMFLFAAALKWRSVTRGDDGMGVVRPELYLPGLGSISLMNIHNLYYLTLVLVVVGIVACYLFLRTPLGNAVMCMRENDVRASFLGYDVFLTKLTVFSFAGLLAGLAGGLFVLFQEFVATTAIDVNRSFAALLMTVIGGTGHFLGPVLGAIFYTVFQDWISSLTKHWILFVGILFVIVVMYLEGGLISLLKWERIRVWVSGQKE